MEYSNNSSTNNKERRVRSSHVSLGQAMLFAAMCSSLAVVVTLMVSILFFSNTMADYQSDRMLATTTRSVISMSRLRPVNHSPSENGGIPNVAPAEVNEQEDTTAKAPLTTAVPGTQDDDGNAADNKDSDDDGPFPRICWLMSFPNSGTSFTLHMTREASNCTTATNYALEGEIKDQPSVPAIEGPLGDQGPWLEVIPFRPSNVAQNILTKTHCKGFCSGQNCGPDKTIQTVRSFMVGCRSGTRAIFENGVLKKVPVTYEPSLVKKAIHIFRHPLDNIVARFHLEYAVQGDRGNSEFTSLFPRNSTGFFRWCASDDSNRGLLESPFMDAKLKAAMRACPCMNDFWRYVQWHNLAFAVSREMNIPTMILHYGDYNSDFEGTRDRVLDWVGLPHEGQGEPFHSGKIYRHYYTDDQKRAIYEFLKEASNSETWEQLKDYKFFDEEDGEAEHQAEEIS